VAWKGDGEAGSIFRRFLGSKGFSKPPIDGKLSGMNAGSKKQEFTDLLLTPSGGTAS